MIQGTTPAHYFTLPFEASLVAAARVIYKQGSKEILRKETESFSREGKRIWVTLSQEETFLFDCKTSVKLQLRVRDVAGKVFNTKPMLASVDECLDTEVL
jgi:hypothetical protein